LLAKLNQHKAEIVAALRLEGGIAPPEPDEAEIEERKGMAAGGVPGPYLDTWARLQCQRPIGVGEAACLRAIDDAGRFVDQWASLAVEFGWKPGDLFDVPRDGAMGLVWWLKSRTVTALGPEHAGVGQPAYDRVTHRDWVNPYARPVRPVSLSPTDTLKDIGGSQSESSPHIRSANALADWIAAPWRAVSISG
jgi:hypothetical protein